MVYKSGQIFYRFVTIHSCDGQTDRRTDRRTEFSLLDRVCILCSALKMVVSYMRNAMHPSHNYKNSSCIVDLAMWQISRFTEGISSLRRSRLFVSILSWG